MLPSATWTTSPYHLTNRYNACTVCAKLVVLQNAPVVWAQQHRDSACQRSDAEHQPSPAFGDGPETDTPKTSTPTTAQPTNTTNHNNKPAGQPPPTRNAVHCRVGWGGKSLDDLAITCKNSNVLWLVTPKGGTHVPARGVCVR